MNSMSIGENIKRLRREKNVTQERLANHLNLSCQAISKWERGDSTPDVTMIVPLANFFRVSADELLGIGPARAEEVVNSYVEEYNLLESEGKTEEKYALVQEAYTQYPNDFRVMELYLNYLCEDPAVDEPFLAHHAEIARLCNAILKECPAEPIRYHAMHVLAKLYYLDGEDAKAAEVLSAFPSVFETKDMLLSGLFEAGSQERTDYARHSCGELLEALLMQIRVIALESPEYNRVEQLSILRKAVQMIQLFVTEEDYGFFHYHMSDLYILIANRYMMTENPQAALENLALSLEHAKAYDALPASVRHTSPILSGNEFRRCDRGEAGVEKKLESQLYYLENTCSKLYGGIMNSAAMQSILKQYRA